MDRVLALSLRPKFLEDCLGQDEISSTLHTQFQTGRIPHFYIIHGPVGAGKTTIARILALALQMTEKDPYNIKEEHWGEYKKYDIQEINAANKNGIDDVRSIVETMKYQPMLPSRAKVVIMDEAHQLTSAAQNALITETEDVAKHVYYIFCTSAINKIIPALQRRAYMITPKPLTEDDISNLLKKASEKTEFSGDIEPLQEALVMHSVTSPGLILQAAEKFFAGIPANESVFNCESSKIDTMAVCRGVGHGSWKDTSLLLKPMTKADINMVRNCILGYLKTMLMNSTGAKALAIAKAIKNVAGDGMVLDPDSTCLPTFLASVCIACEHVKSTLK